MQRTLWTILLLIASVSLKAAEPVRIVSLGDSITRAVRKGVTDQETFSALLQKQLSTAEKPVEVHNLGIGGERTDQALVRLEKDVLSLRPRIVLVMYGHNDSHIDQGTVRPRLTRDEYAGNLRQLVGKIRQANAVPLLMTPPCYSLGNKNGIGGDPDVQLEQYAQSCRDVATELKVILIDNYAAWRKRRDSGEEIRNLTTDGYHPNPEGQRFMAETIRPVIEAELAKLTPK